MAIVNIDGKEFDTDNLSEEANNQIVNLQVCEAKLKQLQQEAAMIQTARNVYAKALQEHLPKEEAEA
jgi:exonuclease I